MKIVSTCTLKVQVEMYIDGTYNISKSRNALILDLFKKQKKNLRRFSQSEH